MRTSTMFYSLAASFTVLLLAGLTQRAAAQTPSTGGPTPQNPTTEVPIDGGASLLLAGSVAYGLRKLRQRRK